MNPAHVAIVGCGFTGTSAFFQLVDGYGIQEVTIFESSGKFGPGYPYQPDECNDYLLNNPTDTLCLVPGNRRAFLNWLETKPNYAQNYDPHGHLPRSVFGLFLTEAFEATRITAAVKGIRVNLIPREATSMAEQPDGQVKIGWLDGETVVDAAILATGRCPDTNPYNAPPPSSDVVYIANHVCTDAFDQIALDAEVHIIGASLSAYDVINRLFSKDTGCRFLENADGSLTFEPGKNERRVVLCSRSGRIKAFQSNAPMEIKRRHFTLEALDEKREQQGLSLTDIASAIMQEATDHGASLQIDRLRDPYKGCGSVQAVNARAGELMEEAIAAASIASPSNFLVDLFSHAQIDLWDGWVSPLLGPAEKARYRAEFEGTFLSYFAPSPISTAQKLLALHRAGRLTYRNGVRNVRYTTSDDAYLISHAFGIDKARVVVNTTGSLDRNVMSSNQPSLIQTLVAENLLHPCCEPEGPIGLGAAVDMTTFRAKGAKNIYIANMLLWGPGFFTSSAFMMALVVERLLEKMFEKSSLDDLVADV